MVQRLNQLSHRLPHSIDGGRHFLLGLKVYYSSSEVFSRFVICFERLKKKSFSSSLKVLSFEKPLGVDSIAAGFSRVICQRH
jgi:hypothetical protein